MVAARLPAISEATQLARDAIDELSVLDDHEDVHFAGALLATELVANAVKHSGLRPDDTFSFVVECSDETLHVAVTDGGSGFDPLHHLSDRSRVGSKHGL